MKKAFRYLWIVPVIAAICLLAAGVAVLGIIIDFFEGSENEGTKAS